MTDNPLGIDRRHFISSVVGVAASGGAVAAALAAETGGDEIKFRTFGAYQGEVFSAWCDLLVPGASAAGVAPYVDRYVSGPYREALLFLRFFQGAPLADFYTAGLLGIDLESVAQFKKPFLDLAPQERRSVVEAAVNSTTGAWKSPDPFFFYLVSRNDAVDVVYGTQKGFQALDIPYLAHIPPDRPW